MRRALSSFQPRLEILEDRLLLTAGVLDPTFGTGGFTIANIVFTDIANDAALQADGKTVVAGSTAVGGPGETFALARFTSAGLLDTSFGTDGTGTVVTDFDPIDRDGSAAGNNGANEVVVTPDGKIIAAGILYWGSFSQFAIARYNADGTLDTTFDGDGLLITSVGSDGFATCLTIQADGKLVVSGTADLQFAVARFLNDGSFDTSFGAGGVVLTDMGPGQSIVEDIALQADGKIVVVGNAAAGFNTPHFAIARYNTDGSLDTSFDGDGRAFLEDLQGNAEARGVAIQADTKIVVVGLHLPINDPEMVVVRLNDDGSLDGSFGTGGIAAVTVTGESLAGQAVALQSDGKIVLTGYDHHPGGSRALVARLLADGTPDVGFGSGGATLDTFTDNMGHSNASAVLLQPDGRILIAGTAGTGGSDSQFFIARYQGDADASLTASISGPTCGVRGQPLTFTVSADSGNPAITFQIDWNGDGSFDQTVVGPSGTLVAHAFPANGTFTPKVQASADGVTSAIANAAPVVITTVAYQPNPSNPAQNALVVGGTSGDDTISILPFGSNWRVTINGQIIGNFASAHRLLVYGQAGNDAIEVGGNITKPALLYGGTGNDTLRGGGGGDGLFGEAGNDTLFGNAGRDILVGGDGQDTLNAGKHDDVLIGGDILWTAPVAISALLSEWNSTRTYPQRVANLLGTGSGPSFNNRLNGNYFLTLNGTVLDDGDVDTLSGQLDRDLFFAHPLDSLLDRAGNETIVQ